jgi:hypothetical protein
MTGPALILISLGFMLFRVVSPRGEHTQGKHLQTFTLTYRERLALQRLNLCALGIILFAGSVGHWIHLPFEILAIVAAYGILMVPVRYQLTTQGVAINRVVFRPWQEFAESKVTDKNIVLVGKPGNGHFTIWIGARHQADIRPLLRRFVQESKSPGSQSREEGERSALSTQFRRLLPRRFSTTARS